MNKNILSELQDKARWLRKSVLTTAEKTGGRGAHLGGTMSCIEILISLYYSGFLNIPRNFNDEKKWEKRDRVIIGKGHAHIALYHIWNDLGFLDNKKLKSYGENGSKLGAQLDRNLKISEYNTGSLGHAIGIATGICLSSRYDKQDYNAYALIGDGECESGSIWESIINAEKEKINNLVVIVDMNRLSEFQIMKDESDQILKQKFISFGWDAEIINGHDFDQLFLSLKNSKKNKKPKAIIANTIKGKGVSFMENNVDWHHKAPSPSEFKIALNEYNDQK
jgi:transketolase